MKQSKIKLLSVIVSLAVVISILMSVSVNALADDVQSSTESQEITCNTDNTTTTDSSQNTEDTEASATEETVTSVSETEGTSSTEASTASSTEKQSTVITTTTKPSATSKPTTPTTPTTKPQSNKKKPVVPTVKKIKKTSSKLTALSFSWTKAKKAYSYYIYVKDADRQKRFKKVKETKKNTYTLNGLRSTTKYEIGIKSVVKYNGKKISGAMKTLKTATNTLDISKVSLKSAGKGITIQWNKRDRVTGYRVYRASSSSRGKYVPYKTIIGTSKTSFTDYKVSPGKLYFYRVSAFRKYTGVGTYYSTLSKSSVVSTAGLDAVKLVATSQLYKINLSWQANKAANTYRVYYSTARNGKYRILTSTSGTSCSTAKLESGKVYYFKVYPCKTFGKTVLFGPSSNIVGKKVSNVIFGRAVSNNYIEISISQQHMWMYKNGKLIVSTPVVTGNDDGVHNTPKGVHYMMCHQSPATLSGPGWNVGVSFWMQFTSDGCGIHDSTWRSSWEYGGTTYKGNGSHGCVNTPYSSVKKIFDNSYVGYKIIVR